MESEHEQQATIGNHRVTINIQTTSSEHWIFLTITPRTTLRATSSEHRNDPITNNLLTRVTRIISAAFRQPVQRHQWETTPHRNRSFHALLAIQRDDIACRN